MVRPRRIFTALVLLSAIVILGALASMRAPYGGFQGSVFVDVEKGAHSGAIASQLANAGVVHHAWQFLLIRAVHPGARLQAGEYQFTQPATPWTVFNRIARGDVFFYSLTVPEGSNQFDIAAMVESLGVMKGSDFLREARKPALIRDLAPDAPTLEGYLFPSTYRLTRNTTPEQLCRLMTGQFRRQWATLAGSAPVDAHAVTTLASLVEKETAVAQERPTVASVYRNRLEKGMALDCDPTTIYAALLDGRYRGAIFRSDLQNNNAYNTYRHAGLPPGPIANPGVASLKAALDPARTGYLFFVAKPGNSGEHRFSSTLAQHDLAVREYRRGIQKTHTSVSGTSPANKHRRS